MTSALRAALIATATLTLGACATSDYDPGPGSSASRQATSAAESACMAAVNGQYGGQVTRYGWPVPSSPRPTPRSSSTPRASEVAQAAERWRCLVSNDGTVQELSVVQ